MNSNEIVDCAVNKCKEIENSLEGCLQVLQKICVTKPLKDAKAFNPCAKSSYIISSGISTETAPQNPNKNELMAGKTNLISASNRHPVDSSTKLIFNRAQMKIRSILERQRHIVEMVDKVTSKLLISQKDDVQIARLEATSDAEDNCGTQSKETSGTILENEGNSKKEESP